MEFDGLAYLSGKTPNGGRSVEIEGVFDNFNIFLSRGDIKMSVNGTI
jgi:hypothetical protein